MNWLAKRRQARAEAGRKLIADAVSKYFHEETRGYGLRARLDYIDQRLPEEPNWRELIELRERVVAIETKMKGWGV